MRPAVAFDWTSWPLIELFSQVGEEQVHFPAEAHQDQRISRRCTWKDWKNGVCVSNIAAPKQIDTDLATILEGIFYSIYFVGVTLSN